MSLRERVNEAIFPVKYVKNQRRGMKINGGNRLINVSETLVKQHVTYLR